MSSIIKPVTSFVKGVFGLGGKQKLNKIKPMDISAQTSEEGNPQPVVWGISRPIGGNVIYQSQPIRVIKKERVEGGGGGKGGSSKKKQYQNVEYIYRYYAIRVCRGDGIIYRRIWRNNKLVYDARRGSAWGAKNNHLFLQKARLYSGSWEQMPDSILETQLGVGNVPAFRGLAYMVINYEDVTDIGGAIPQYTFEVCRPNGFILTSRPYAQETDEEFFEQGLLPAELAEPEKLTMVGLSVKSAKYIEDTVTHEAFSDNGISVNSVEIIQDLVILQGNEQVQATVNVVESTIDAADEPVIVYKLKSSVHIVSGDIE